VRRCAAWSVTTPWHCATHSRTADAPHPRKRTADPSKGRRTTTSRPRKDNAVTSVRRDRSPPSPAALCDHPRHRDAIPATASPSLTLWKRAVTGRRHAGYRASYGLTSTAPSSPHAGGRRTSDPYATTLEAAPGRIQDTPCRPARSKIRQDGRLLRVTVRHASTRRRNSVARL
jgi:hypothetical protein